MDKHTRRVRGNSQPPEDEDLPISYWAPDEPEPEPEPDTNETVDFMIALVIIVGCIVVVSWAFGRGLV